MNKSKKRPWLKWLIGTLSGLFLIAVLGYVFIAYLLPIPDSLELKPRHVSTKIYDRNGQLLYEVLSQGEGRKTYVKLSDMPEQFLQAILASEDSNFYSHIGVDLGAISRALFYNYLEQKITSGASTITQQLVRNLLGTNRQRNLQEKLLETIYAIRLSNAYSKNQVLEEYLNTVYFGNLSYGAGEAAKNYFNKNLYDLDLAEISILAGLPKSPSAYNPLVNPDKAKKRQQYVLGRMVELGNVSGVEAEQSARRRITYASGKTPIAAPHFVNRLLAELEEEYGEDYIHSGLSITTTIDLDMQLQAESIIDRRLEELTDKNVGNSAMLAATVPDGQILVWIGSKDFFDDEIDGQVDIITSLRQPGSALKPFLYLLALERGDTLATIIPDLPMKVKTEGGVYSPLNYDLDFHGPIRLREALANSFNIPAVKTQEKLGTGEFLSFLHKLGLNTLDQKPDYYGLALTLGGGEIRLADLANAYLSLANYGNKKEFTKVLEIKDANNETIYKLKQPPSRDILGRYGTENSSLIIDTISDPDARLKSFGEDNMLELSVPAAVKTGTTRNFRDNWTFGFSPYLLTAVWVGNADATPMENISGIDGAGPIWHDFMEYYHEQNEYLHLQMSKSFRMPPSITEISICAISGLLPGENCQENLQESFITGTEPRQKDNFWRRYICPSGESPDQERYFINYPHPYKNWAEERGFTPPAECRIDPTGVTPPDSQESSEISEQAPMEIVSPLEGDSFEITSNLPLDSQKIPLKIIVYPQVNKEGKSTINQIQLFINNQLVKTENLTNQTEVREMKELWLPSRGRHTLKAQLTATDKGKNEVQEVHFTIQ